MFTEAFYRCQGFTDHPRLYFLICLNITIHLKVCIEWKRKMVEEVSRIISSRTTGPEGWKRGNNIYLEGNNISCDAQTEPLLTTTFIALYFDYGLSLNLY